MALLLHRTDQPVRGIEVTARGVCRDGLPTVFTDISLGFTCTARTSSPGGRRALLATEQHMGPVWAMLEGGPRITSSCLFDVDAFPSPL